MKYLIVNADDLGYSKGVNEGIIEAHTKGVVTSTSLMVYGVEAKHGISLAKKYPQLGIGLHFQITKPDIDIISRQVKKVLAVATIEKTKNEFLRQIELFKKLTGEMPDHIDGHYHIHKLPRIFSFIRKFANEKTIPMRDYSAGFIKTFYGMFDENNISVIALVEILKTLPEGVSELMCHPAKYTDDLNSSYKKQREIELKTLASKEVKEAIKNNSIKLISWSGIKDLKY